LHFRGWKHDECIYKRIQTHQQTGVPMSSKVKSDYGKKVQTNRKIGANYNLNAYLLIIIY
jgi:hypothetical protein